MPTALPQLGALVAQWDADAYTAQTDNTAMATTWIDGVGGAIADPSPAAIKPKYRATAFPGGKPCIEFTGTTCWLEVLRAQATAMVAALDSKTYTVIAIIDGIGVKTNGIVIASNTSGLDGLYLLANGTRVGTYSGGTSASTATPFTTAANGAAVLARTAYLGSKGGGAGIMRTAVNGTFFRGDPGTPVGTGSGLNIGIGGRQGTGALGGIFKMAQLLVWNTDLSPADVLQVQKWYCDKYSQPYPWSINPAQRFNIHTGDSITMGATATGVEFSYPYLVAQSLGLAYGLWTNIGIGGISMAQMDAIRAVDVDPIPAMVAKPCIISFFEVYNQGVAQTTAASISRTYANNLRTANPSMKQVFGTSTDAASPFTTYNSIFDADHAQFDGYVPIHLNTHIGVAGTYTNSTYFAPDGIHLTGFAAPSGYNELKNEFLPAITALLPAVATGDAAITLAPATLSAAGIARASGSLATTLASSVLTAAGVVVALDPNKTYGTLACNRIQAPTQKTTVTGSFLTSAREHFSSPEGDTTDLQFLDVGWYIIDGTLLVTNTSAYPLQRWVEYPAGVFTPVLWGGGSTGNVAAGGQTLSDKLTGLVIPPNTRWVERTQFPTAGVDIPTNELPAAATAIGVTDGNALGLFGNSGTINPTSTTATAGAMAIICTVSKAAARAFVIVTDSIGFGQGDITGSGATKESGWISRGLSGQFPHLKIAKKGWSAQQIAAEPTGKVVAALAVIKFSDLIAAPGINDLSLNSRTAAQVLADQQTIYANYGFGARVYQTTLTTRTATSNAYADVPGQTTKVDGNMAGLPTVNAAIRAKPAGVFGVIEINAFANTTATSNIWAGPFPPTTDGTHPTSPKAAQMAALVPTSISTQATIIGSAGLTLGATTLTAGGLVGIAGSAGLTLGAASITAAGVVGSSVAIGSLGVTLSPVGMAAAGTVVSTARLGDLSATLAPVALAAAGLVTGATQVTGTLSVALGAITAAGNGAALVTGSMGLALAPSSMSGAGIIGAGNPDADAFRIAFPSFAAVPTATIAFWLARAARVVDDSWTEGDRVFGRQLLAAHLMTQNGIGMGAEAAMASQGAAGFKSMKSGSLSLERFDGDDGAGYSSTSYGKQFATLLGQNRRGALVTPSGTLDCYGYGYGYGFGRFLP